MTIQEVVAKKLKLYAKRKVINMLDGNYDSVFKGKGVELESLRPYVHGDSIKDIDWNSTARTGEVHTRLYTPLRDQKILVVVDCTSSMQLSTVSGLNKKDAVYGMVVTLGMFVSKNRDQLSVCVGEPDGSSTIGKYGYTNNHIEKSLRKVDSSLQYGLVGRPPELIEMLSRVHSSQKQRTAIFIVSDTTLDHSEYKPILNKLGLKHQLFWLQLEASSPFVTEPIYNQQVVDIETKRTLTADDVISKKLQSEWSEEIEKLRETRKKVCRSAGVAYGEVSFETELLPEMRKMFIQAKNYAKRH